MSNRQRRSQAGENLERIVAYLPIELVERLKKKADKEQRSLSSHIASLVAKDLEGWKP